MSSSVALLPKKKKDHPIFMRICHSSWTCIGQQLLVSLRLLLATYLVASFAALINYDLYTLELEWQALFKLSNIAYLSLVIFHVLAAIWAYMHLYYPHHASQPRSFSTRLQKLLSPPRQNPETKNRDWFSIFYFSTNAFNLVVVFIFWVVLYPKNKTDFISDGLLDSDYYTTFYIFSKHAVNAAIVVFEVFFLNGHVRSLPIQDHPKRITWHIIAFAALAWIYVGWAYIGHHYTGKYSYFFLDYEKYGKEYTWFSLFLFVLSAEFAALFLWLLTALKEKCTEKDTNGYTVLPQ